MRWRAYCEELLTWVDRFGANLVVTLGALLADSPHTRPVPVSGHASDAALSAALDLDISRYKGPTGINGVFTDAVAANALSCVSLWAAVPHYVSQTPCPKATLALLGRLEEVLGVPLPVGELVEASRPGSAGSTSCPVRTPTSPPTSSRWRRRATPATCRRPPATRSP
jgi:predicted ATP-grasp superfamily ATP-dependent carboligase